MIPIACLVKFNIKVCSYFKIHLQIIEYLAADPEFSGSIPATTRFFFVAVDLERGPLSPCEDKWGATWKESSGPGLQNWH
jgi:hypothetical protein